MSVAFDSIIFGLQLHGGISNYWTRLIDAYRQVRRRDGTLVLPRQLLTADLPNMADLRVVRERFSPKLARYGSAPVPIGTRTCHSSYYRVPARPVGKLVVSVYDFTYERYASGARRAVHRWQKRRSIKAADLALCISESTRNDLLNEIPSMDPRNVLVTHLGVDTTRFHQDTSAQTPAQPPYVLFVGQRGGYKRFDVAVAALRGMPNLALGIVGPPLSIAEKDHLSAHLGERWIEFGTVDVDQLRALYSNAHAFIFPSDYEGFGLPLLEAMACGCPVVAADRSSFPEIVGKAAMLAPAQDGEAYRDLIDRLSGPTLRGEQIAAGFERIKKFSWDSTFAQTFDHYD